MNLFDAHCHLENNRFQNDVQDVLSRMTEAGVNRCVIAGSDMQTSSSIVELVRKIPAAYGVVGIHPHEAKDFQPSDLEQIAAWQQQPKIVGIGEIGLDYFYDFSPRDTQKEALLQQLLLARRLNVPVVFHVRDAHGDLIELLKAHRDELPAGMMHCYSGSVESAKVYLDLGFYISFAGPVTFRGADKLRQVARYCPIDRIMVETDSPYLAPVPMRGKRNEPTFVEYVARVVAQERDMPEEALAQSAFENTCRLFGIA